MFRLYLSAVALTVLLYPLAWYIMLGAERTRILYGDPTMVIVLSLAIALGSMLGLVVAQHVAQQVHPMYQGLVVRFGGALIGAQVPAIAILVMLYVVDGVSPTLAGWWNFQGISLIPLFVTYWIIHLLVKQLAPSIFDR